MESVCENKIEIYKNEFDKTKRNAHNTYVKYGIISNDRDLFDFLAKFRNHITYNIRFN